MFVYCVFLIMEFLKWRVVGLDVEFDISFFSVSQLLILKGYSYIYRG